MNENTTDSNPTPDDFADVLDDWINGATVAKRSVDVYGNPALYADYEDLERRLAVAQAKTKLDESLGDSSVEDIETAMEKLYEEFMASKSTWTIRALSEDDFRDLREGLVWPVEPKDPDLSDPEKASMLQAAYDQAKKAFDAETTKITDLLNLQVLARAVVNIRFADGREVPSVTVEQLEKLRQRLGERQLLKLIHTSQLATYEEPKVPAPFSRSTTQGDQT